MSIRQSAHEILDQLESVLTQFSDDQFGQSLEVLGHSSIGQHVRHTLEFFICLMDAKTHHVINYDNRDHDKLIETHVALAMRVIKSIKDFLDRERTDFDLVLKANYEVESTGQVEIKSNYYRELAYNIEHAIHHMALIKIGIRDAFPTATLPDHFGVASSTIRYQHSH